MKFLRYSFTLAAVFALPVSCLLLLSCRHEVDTPVVPGTAGNGNTGTSTGNNSGGTGSGTGAGCDTTKIYFQQQVLPVLLSNCTQGGCHDDVSHQDGVVLTSYEKVMGTAGIRPGRPSESELYEVLLATDPDKRMPRPPRNPLSSQQIAVIREWIRQGALNLTCTSSCDSSRYSYAAVIQPLVSSKCQGCHSGATPQGGIDLSNYTAIKASVTNGKFWGAVSHSPGYSPMPKNGNKLSDCELTLIRKWIQAGALNN